MKASSMTVFYNETEYETTAKELEMKNPNSVSGTIKLHALFAAHNQLYTAKVSYVTVKPVQKANTVDTGK